jgi:hypothetical protein
MISEVREKNVKEISLAENGLLRNFKEREKITIKFIQNIFLLRIS